MNKTKYSSSNSKKMSRGDWLCQMTMMMKRSLKQPTLVSIFSLNRKTPQWMCGFLGQHKN